VGVSCPQPPSQDTSTSALLGGSSRTWVFDQKDTAEEWAARAPANCPVGGGSYAMEYIDHGLASPQSPEGKVPEGFSRIEVGEIVAYTNGKPRQGKDWHSDGSKLVQTGESEVHRAGTALTCGELQIISRVQGPQTSYRAELQGARLFADVAENGDTLTLDNKSVVDYMDQSACTEKLQAWITASRWPKSYNPRTQS